MDIVTLTQIVYDYGILVFLLVFTIVFAILQKTNILGAGRKNFNAVIALVMALVVLVPHISGDYHRLGLPDIVEVINQALPQVSLLAIAGVMLLLLVGLFGGESRWLGSSLSGWIAILAFIFIVVIFGSQSGLIGEVSLADYIGEDTLILIVVILVFGIIIWYITKEPGEGEFMAKTGNILQDIGNFFGGQK